MLAFRGSTAVAEPGISGHGTVRPKGDWDHVNERPVGGNEWRQVWPHVIPSVRAQAFNISDGWRAPVEFDRHMALVHHSEHRAVSRILGGPPPIRRLSIAWRGLLGKYGDLRRLVCHACLLGDGSPGGQDVHERGAQAACRFGDLRAGRVGRRALVAPLARTVGIRRRRGGGHCGGQRFHKEVGRSGNCALPQRSSDHL